MPEINPFFLNDYQKDFFCGREEETRQLLGHIQNGRNTTLLGLRGIGKTALINHVLAQLEQTSNILCFYINILPSENENDFIMQFANGVAKFINERTSQGKTLSEWINTNLPSHLTGKQKRAIKTYEGLYRENEKFFRTQLEFIDKQQIKLVIAIDEFQQIGNYADNRSDELFKMLIQNFKNISFIFAGSDEILFNDLLNKVQVEGNIGFVHLPSLKETVYRNFIEDQFEKEKRRMGREAVDFILAWTRSHTLYTQVLCNRIFNSGLKEIEIEDVHEECGRLLNENENGYYVYRNLLASMQWALLKAIAKEEKVYHPTARQFLQEYNVGTPANIQRALEALLHKEMIFVTNDENGRYYQVYDCFLSRWLENLD